MSKNETKLMRAAMFRDRLAQAMTVTQTNQSALARQTGVDRSTLSQLLKDDGVRMPNAQLVAEAAIALGVSADWLLGLSDRPEQATALLAEAMTITKAPRALIDEQIFGWHQEAAGYKIRHVPAGLPDMLKTKDLLQWEYEPSLGRTTQQAIGASDDRLTWMRSAGSDYEIALPLYELESFASGTGYYADLPATLRTAQLQHLRKLHNDLYPSLRLHLFDARRLFSAPITVFGPLLAVVYLGTNYLAFRDTERVKTITRHFDGLVREASVSSRELPDHITWLESLI